MVSEAVAPGSRRGGYIVYLLQDGVKRITLRSDITLSHFSPAAPGGGGGVDVERPDPPSGSQVLAGGPEPEDPSEPEGDKSLSGCCLEPVQVSQPVKSFAHHLLSELGGAGLSPERNPRTRKNPVFSLSPKDVLYGQLSVLQRQRR